MLAGLLALNLVTTVVPLDATADPVSWLVNYGVAGIVILLLVTGQLRTKSEVAGLQKALGDADERARQKDVALSALMAQMTGHTVPQLTDLSRVLNALPDRLDALSAKIEENESRRGTR